jgi:hypothetical protein
MRLFHLGLMAISGAAIFAVASESTAQTPSPVPTVAATLSYADMADLALAAPIVVQVRVTSAALLKREEAAAVPADEARFYVEAEVVTLIRGATGLPGEVSYLADLPRTAGGRPPKLRKKSEFLLFASPVAGKPGELRLIAPDAQIPFEAAEADQVRTILREAMQPDAPPRIVGIGKAFNVPGSLPGEGETQIFLLAADGRPVSLSVLRRPGETPRWAIALTEIVDEAAAPPAPNSLLWYRLACTLPRALPRESVSDADPAAASATEADYRFVLDRLGPCARTRNHS